MHLAVTRVQYHTSQCSGRSSLESDSSCCRMPARTSGAPPMEHFNAQQLKRAGKCEMAIENKVSILVFFASRSEGRPEFSCAVLQSQFITDVSRTQAAVGLMLSKSNRNPPDAEPDERGEVSPTEGISSFVDAKCKSIVRFSSSTIHHPLLIFV
jgi:hypothetical protein